MTLMVAWTLFLAIVTAGIVVGAVVGGAKAVQVIDHRYGNGD